MPPPIQMSGLVSGLDTASIIDQLMAVEKIPRTKITNDQAIDDKKVSLYNDLSTKLTALKFANDDLSSALTWIDTQTVESTDTTKFTVTRTGGAPPGGYDVSVDQLASAERQTYGRSRARRPTARWTSTTPTARRASTVDLKAGATVDDAVSAINGATGGQPLRGQRQRQPRPERQDDRRQRRASRSPAPAPGTQTERIAGQQREAHDQRHAVRAPVQHDHRRPAGRRVHAQGQDRRGHDRRPDRRLARSRQGRDHRQGQGLRHGLQRRRHRRSRRADRHAGGQRLGGRRHLRRARCSATPA